MKISRIETIHLGDIPHDVGSLVELRRCTSTPLLATEYLMTRYEYRPLLEARGADIVIIDPTWTGGVTEGRKIASMAEAYNLPVTMHDCTGPLTLFAGVHLALSAPNAMYQETVRAFLRTFYPELVTESVVIQDGHILAPTAPGLGTALLPDLARRPDATLVESVPT